MTKLNPLSMALMLTMATAPLHSTLADQDLAGSYYEKALIAKNKHDNVAAIIELKNAIQQNQGYVAAHLLLGEIYLQQKALTEAEVQLGLADELGADKSLTVKLLAQLYLSQLKYQQLIDEIDPANFPQDLRPDLLVYRGNAFLQMNRVSEALNEYAMALQLEPERVDAALGKANALLRRGDINGATLLVDSLAAAQPQTPGVWQTRGWIQHKQGNLSGALNSFDKAVELDPDDQNSRTVRASILMDLNQDQRAKQDLEYLREHYPHDPQAAYLHSVLLTRNGQTEAAEKELVAAADIIASVRPEFLTKQGHTLMLAGLVNYSLQRFDQAAEYLRQYINQYPDQPGPYKLLSSILLTKNEPERVVDLLRPVYARNPNDSRLMFLLASAYSQTGKHDQANLILDKLSKLSSDADGDLDTEIGLNRLSLGQERFALDELESSFKKNPGNLQAGIPLVVTYINNHRGTDALRVAQAMQAKVSKNLTVLNLLGTAQVSVQLLKQARASFEQAVALDPNFLTAHINLSKLDVAEKNYTQAKDRLQTLLKQHPNDLSLLIELATVEQANNDFDAANRWLEKARNIDQKSLDVLLAQIDLKLKTNRASEALSLAQAGQLIAKDDWQLLNALARCYLATDSRDKAIGVYNNLAELARFNVKLLYQVAELQSKAGDYAEAIKTLKKAVLADEKHIPSQIALVRLELNYGKPVFAKSRAQNLQKTYPLQAFPNELLGDIATHDRDFKQATEQYQNAFNLEPSVNRLVKLYQSLVRNEQRPQAFNLLEDWLKKHPKDNMAMAALANELMENQQYAEAGRYYEILLKQYPDEAMFLNNIAYAYSETGDPKALEYAQKAQQLAPEQAASNDTLGWILVKQNKADEGLHYLRNAHSRAAQDPEIRYHIAVALQKLSRDEEARQELEQALKSNKAFNGQAQAKSLLEKLKK